MSKKITQISGYSFALVLKPAIKIEFEKSLSYKSIDDEAKEFLSYGTGELAYEINEFIQSGKFLAVEYFLEACIVKLEDGFYKMFISLLGANRKSEEQCTKDFSTILNIRKLKADDENHRKWEEREEELMADRMKIMLARIEAEELEVVFKDEAFDSEEFSFEDVPDEISQDKVSSGRAKTKL